MQNTTTAVEVRVPGSSLPLYTDGKRLVALKPIAEYFGLDWAGQFTKLKSKSVWHGKAGRARRGTVWLGAAGLGRQG